LLTDITSVLDDKSIGIEYCQQNTRKSIADTIGSNTNTPILTTLFSMAWKSLISFSSNITGWAKTGQFSKLCNLCNMMTQKNCFIYRDLWYFIWSMTGVLDFSRVKYSLQKCSQTLLH